MKVFARPRPFLLTFTSSGHSYPLTSEDAQRLLDSEHIVTATRNRVVMHETNSTRRVLLTPATLGGGPAFDVTR